MNPISFLCFNVPRSWTAGAGACLLFLFLPFSSVLSQMPDASSEFNDDLLIGVHTDFRVVDGDTFRIEGMDRGVRFLNIDTEEVPRGSDASEKLEQLRANWPEAYAEERGNSRFPVKMPTPFGWETSEAAKHWFDDVDTIRIERDSDDNVYGFFDRWLGYVFARKDGRWVNYNVECVRMGWSPYYGKYGYSERFHDAFVAAQKEAEQAQHGIWNPAMQHYPDYDERLEWWNRRGDAIRTFTDRFRGKESHYFIGRDGEFERLALAQGERVVVFGAVGWLPKSRPAEKLRISHKRGMNVTVLLPFDASETWLTDREQQYVYVRGTVSGGGKNIVITPEHSGDVSLEPLDLQAGQELHFRGSRKE